MKNILLSLPVAPKAFYALVIRASRKSKKPKKCQTAKYFFLDISGWCAPRKQGKVSSAKQMAFHTKHMRRAENGKINDRGLATNGVPHLSNAAFHSDGKINYWGHDKNRVTHLSNAAFSLYHQQFTVSCLRIVWMWEQTIASYNLLCLMLFIPEYRVPMDSHSVLTFTMYCNIIEGKHDMKIWRFWSEPLECSF